MKFFYVVLRKKDWWYNYW